MTQEMTDMTGAMSADSNNPSYTHGILCFCLNQEFASISLPQKESLLFEYESSILQRFSVKMRRNCINKYMSRRAIYMQPSGLLHMKSNPIFQSKTFLHYEFFMSRILIFIEISLMAVFVVFRFLLVFGNTEFKVSK